MEGSPRGCQIQRAVEWCRVVLSGGSAATFGRPEWLPRDKAFSMSPSSLDGLESLSSKKAHRTNSSAAVLGPMIDFRLGSRLRLRGALHWVNTW